MLNKLKNIFTGKEARMSKFREATLAEFEREYKKGREKFLLVGSQKCNSDCVNRNDKQAEMARLERALKHQIFEDAMRLKYNEEQIVVLLKNSPNDFFGRGWCYSSNKYFAENAQYDEENQKLTTNISWRFLLPNCFWEKPENVQAFVAGAEKYWNMKMQLFCDQNVFERAFKNNAKLSHLEFDRELQKHMELTLESLDKLVFINKKLQNDAQVVAQNNLSLAERCKTNLTKFDQQKASLQQIANNLQNNEKELCAEFCAKAKKQDGQEQQEQPEQEKQGQEQPGQEKQGQEKQGQEK